MQDAATASLAAADEALTLNPRSRRHREPLAVLHRLQERLDPVITQVIGMTRAYYDQYDDSLPAEPAARAIAEQLHKAAHDVRLAVQESPVGVEPSEETSAIPALTTPLVVQPPSSGHWILIGSLMEDLRRIHNGMTDDE